MEYFSDYILNNPYWRKRNEKIANELMVPNKSVLDLGCGAKNLLNYYTPSTYLGVDGGAKEADIIIDLDTDFNLPGEWDYVVNSGILEYLFDVDVYLKKIKHLGNEYIFTWWQGQGFGRMSAETFKNNFLLKYYTIDVELDWGKQKIYKCKIKKND
jgi:hypothetical protein